MKKKKTQEVIIKPNMNIFYLHVPVVQWHPGDTLIIVMIMAVPSSAV